MACRMNEELENFNDLGTPSMTALDPVTAKAITDSKKVDDEIEKALAEIRKHAGEISGDDKKVPSNAEDALPKFKGDADTTKKFKKLKLEKLTLDESLFEDVAQDRVVIYKDGNNYYTDSETNYNAPVSNSRKVHKVEDATLAQDIIDMYINQGWATDEKDFLVIDN